MASKCTIRDFDFFALCAHIILCLWLWWLISFQEFGSDSMSCVFVDGVIVIVENVTPLGLSLSFGSRLRLTRLVIRKVTTVRIKPPAMEPTMIPARALVLNCELPSPLTVGSLSI